MLPGQEFGLRANSNSPRVCIIHEAFAKRFFAGRDPIGKHVTDVFGDNRITMEVVGVAKNARDHQLRDDVPPRFYVPVDQVGQSVGGVPASIDFEVRTTGDPERMLTSVRKAVLSANGDVSISNARPLVELVDTYNAQARLIAKLCTIFVIIALLLAATGIYGVLSYRVARRTSQIGIRMA